MPKGHSNTPASRYRGQAQMKWDTGLVAQLARTHTREVIEKLVSLMRGRGGTAKVLDRAGNMVEVDIEVPASVQAKCAELLLNRGYGAVPVGILIDEASTGQQPGALPIAQRIAMLKQALSVGDATTDLEASEANELDDAGKPRRSAADFIEVTALPAPTVATAAPADLI